MKIYVGVTDAEWYRNLASHKPPVEDVNFWRPGGGVFKVLTPGSPFAFRLKAPINKIAGVAFFHSYTVLPLRLTWETFGIRNGRDSYDAIVKAIARYKRQEVNGLTEVGCILLESPVFFDQSDWIPTPTDWSDSIVQGKSYESESKVGAELWNRISALLQSGRGITNSGRPQELLPIVFGKEYLRKSRPGQAGFKIGLLNAYERRCAITGENIVPVLEAAHIQPVTLEGTNELTNGLLLRSDMHKLFDDGLIGITPDRTVTVSSQIRELYVNGKVYYNWHGKRLTVLPNDEALLPSPDRLEWHMKNVFVK